MLRLLSFNEGFRVGNRLEPELTRQRGRVAGLNANMIPLANHVLATARAAGACMVSVRPTTPLRLHPHLIISLASCVPDLSLSMKLVLARTHAPVSELPFGDPETNNASLPSPCTKRE